MSVLRSLNGNGNFPWNTMNSTRPAQLRVWMVANKSEWLTGVRTKYAFAVLFIRIWIFCMNSFESNENNLKHILMSTLKSRICLFTAAQIELVRFGGDGRRLIIFLWISDHADTRRLLGVSVSSESYFRHSNSSIGLSQSLRARCDVIGQCHGFVYHSGASRISWGEWKPNRYENLKFQCSFQSIGSYISSMPWHLEILGSAPGTFSISYDGVQWIVCWCRHRHAIIWHLGGAH